MANYSFAMHWLEELTDEVVLAHPLKVRAIAEARVKTDKIDPETLAISCEPTRSPRPTHPHERSGGASGRLASGCSS